MAAATSSAIAKPPSKTYWKKSPDIKSPRNPFESVTTEQGLPNSNHAKERTISQSAAAVTGPIDRRRIPPAAEEGHWQTSDGHSIRRIDWPGLGEEKRGSAWLLPGRGDHYEKYLETLEEWHRAGWRVTASDWRGQGGSGRLGRDAVTGHIDDFGVWIEDLAYLWERWKAETPAPHILAAHSMGGHLALRAVAEGTVDPVALVLSAPMLGFTNQVLPIPMMHSVAKWMNRLGDGRRPAWKWSEKPGENPAARISLLTHDKARYEDELWWRENRPELVMGPGSWHWVERAYESMRGVMAPGVLEQVTTPVIMIATSNDKLVDIKAIDEAARRLPDCELIRFGDEAHHEILREVDGVRDRAMGAIAQFLDKVAPPA